MNTKLQNLAKELKALPGELENSKEFYMQLGAEATAQILLLLYKAKSNHFLESDGISKEKFDNKLTDILWDLREKESKCKEYEQWMLPESYDNWEKILRILWQMYKIVTDIDISDTTFDQ